jgi:signal transduction histidine kinase
MNLILNSMDAMVAMPYGRTVIGRTEMNGGSSAVIRSRIPVPEFRRNGRTRSSTPYFTTGKQGMGVGLSIARAIVQAHKGRIWAENQTGGGAVFHLSLPLALS